MPQTHTANEKVRLGWIGCGNRGSQLLNIFLKLSEIEVAAVCDVHRGRAESARQLVDQSRRVSRRSDGNPDASGPATRGGSVMTCSDYRKLLDQKDIDAVVVAAPDHWHCLATIHACQAGKDVYVEKPLAYSIAEGRLMMNAAQRYDRIVMGGTQQRSMPHFREAIAFLHTGALGKISEVRSWNLNNRPPNGYGNPPDADPPGELDWDQWLGPAPHAAFNPNRFAQYYWFWDYGGGLQSVWGVHHHDVIHWAMKSDHPISAIASGGRFICADNTEVPDTFETVLEYPAPQVPPEAEPPTRVGGRTQQGGFISIYSLRRGNASPQHGVDYGTAFYGENGTMVLNRGGWRVLPELKNVKEPRALARAAPRGLKPAARCAAQNHAGSPEDPDHQRHFIEAVKAHKKPEVADIETLHRSSIPGHLANIAYRMKRKIHWDAEKEEIAGDPQANEMLTRSYRAPWTLKTE